MATGTLSRWTVTIARFEDWIQKKRSNVKEIHGKLSQEVKPIFISSWNSGKILFLTALIWILEMIETDKLKKMKGIDTLKILGNFYVLHNLEMNNC